MDTSQQQSQYNSQFQYSNWSQGPPSYDDAVMAYHAGEDRVDHVNNPDPGNHSIPRHQVLTTNVHYIRLFPCSEGFA